MATQVNRPEQPKKANDPSGPGPQVLSADITFRISSGSPEFFELQAKFTARLGVTVLFGRSGAGKTTVLDCIAGLVRPQAGHIAIGDDVLFDGATNYNAPVSRRNIGYVFQSLALFPHLTVGGNIAYGIAGIPRTERNDRIESVLRSMRIEHLCGRRPGDVSGGEKQRVALARALVMNPRVLLLDEPLSGLDAPLKSRILDDLLAWNDIHRIPILYVTHSRQEVFSLSDHVIVLDNGKVLADGRPNDVMENPPDEAVADITGFKNIFDAQVQAIHEDRGTMTCQVGVVALEVPLARAQVRDTIRLGIRAGDVLLATVRPESISARNIIPAKVTSVTTRDRICIVQVDCGVLLEVHCTPHAREMLHIIEGLQVWLVLKTHSCHILRRKS